MHSVLFVKLHEVRYVEAVLYIHRHIADTN